MPDSQVAQATARASIITIAVARNINVSPRIEGLDNTGNNTSYN
jgi:hypothetical protein